MKKQISSADLYTSTCNFCQFLAFAGSATFPTNRELYRTHVGVEGEGMRTNCRSWKTIAGFSLVLITLFLFQSRSALAQTQEPPKQTHEVEELKQRLQQLEQTVLELKGQINAIEDAKKHSPAPAIVEATYSEPAATTTTAPPAKPQSSQGESSFEIYGFAMLYGGFQ